MRRIFLKYKIKKGGNSKEMKRIIACLLALCLVLGLVGCGSSVEKETPDTQAGDNQGQATGKPQKLNMLFMSGIYADSAREITEEFKEETGLEVEVDDVPYVSLHEKIMLDFSSQAGGYDVIMLNVPWLGEALPYLEPLDPYIEKNNVDIEDFIPSILDACKWDGVQYGLPRAPTPNMMTYRTDLVETPPKTYEEYLAIAKKFTDPSKGMYGISIPGKKAQYAVQYLVRLWAMGGEVADEDWNVTILSDEANRRAMENLVETSKYADEACLSWELEESINAFLQGNAVFCEAWPTLGLIQNADNPQKSKVVGKWAIAPFPEEVTSKKQMSLHSIVISKYSKNKDAAFQWLNMLMSAEKQTQFYEQFGVLPSRSSFWQREDIKNSSIGPIGEGIKDGLPKWRIPVSAELDSIMANAVGSCMSGQMTVDEAIEFFDSELKRAIENNPPPEGSKNINAVAVKDE
jgi:multiple sugar transport system substrate-binding protein